jgi:hypothetical protein
MVGLTHTLNKVMDRALLWIVSIRAVKSTLKKKKEEGMSNISTRRIPEILMNRVGPSTMNTGELKKKNSSAITLMETHTTPHLKLGIDSKRLTL